MENTKVVVTCISKKESVNWDVKNPISTSIELTVPYDQNSIYFQMSGGTTMILNTVNQEAANMFILNGKYDMIISPSINENQ